MSEYCAFCYQDLPNNKNARYRYKGSEFCNPRCKFRFQEKFVKQEKAE